jgi:uncharacterized protein
VVFPLSYLAESDEDSIEWRLSFIRTFLERDIPSLGINIGSSQIRRLWTMLAHSSGQIINYSKLAGSLGISRTKVKHYIDIRDSGILHSLLEIDSLNSLLSHPVYGQSWEGFAMENILSILGRQWKSFFYRSEKGNEIDLVLEKGNKRICIEFKVSTAPNPNKGLWIALEDLKPERTWIISPVDRAYPLHSEKKVWVGNILHAVEWMYS